MKAEYLANEFNNMAMGQPVKDPSTLQANSFMKTAAEHMQYFVRVDVEDVVTGDKKTIFGEEATLYKVEGWEAEVVAGNPIDKDAMELL